MPNCACPRRFKSEGGVGFFLKMVKKIEASSKKNPTPASDLNRRGQAQFGMTPIYQTRFELAVGAKAALADAWHRTSSASRQRGRRARACVCEKPNLEAL